MQTKVGLLMVYFKKIKIIMAVDIIVIGMNVMGNDL